MRFHPSLKDYWQIMAVGKCNAIFFSSITTGKLPTLPPTVSQEVLLKFNGSQIKRETELGVGHVEEKKACHKRGTRRVRRVG